MGTIVNCRLQSALAEQSRMLGGAYLPSLPGIPPLQSDLLPACFAPAVTLLRAKITALLEHVDGENRFIYFLVVPTQLPELPAEASVMNPAPYEEPQYAGEPIVFTPRCSDGDSSKKSRGFFSGFLRRGSSSGSSDKGETCAAARDAPLSASPGSSKRSLSSHSSAELCALVPPSSVGSPMCDALSKQTQTEDQPERLELHSKGVTSVSVHSTSVPAGRRHQGTVFVAARFAATILFLLMTLFSLTRLLQC